MAIKPEIIWEVYEGLKALGESRTRTDEIPELQGEMTINGARACWPRSTINDVLRSQLLNPLDVHKVFRELQKLRIVNGPHKTSRMVDGQKVNYEVFHVSLRALLTWENEHS